MNRLWPFRNLGLKLLSVGIGALLWMSVSGEEVVERGLRAPLELQQFPQGLEIQGEAPSTVDVRVRGTSGALSRVGAGDIVAVLDLHGVRAGNRLFALMPEQVRSPFGVEVVQVTPSTIALALEQSLTRSVPVAPSLEGSPSSGYVVAG
ncbi:MAG TPA: CdaR family protein, partial [Vicinamibacterales bacterium]|nr:CdaR family protein [Vicinamibacterales bacterium]